MFGWYCHTDSVMISKTDYLLPVLWLIVDDAIILLRKCDWVFTQSFLLLAGVKYPSVWHSVLTVAMPCPKQEWPFGKLDRCSGKKESIATPLEINVLGRHKSLSTLGNPVSNPHWTGSTWREELAAPWGEDQFGLSAFVCRPKLLIYHPGLVEPLTSAVTSLPSAPCVTPSSTCIHVPHPLVRVIFPLLLDRLLIFLNLRLIVRQSTRFNESLSVRACVRACVRVCVCMFCWVFHFLLLITIMITIDIS